jgi:hypothetical protein
MSVRLFDATLLRPLALYLLVAAMVDMAWKASSTWQMCRVVAAVARAEGNMNGGMLL